MDVTTYATLSHLYNDALTNQQHLKNEKFHARHRINVKVSRRLLRSVAACFFYKNLN